MDASKQQGLLYVWPMSQWVHTSNNITVQRNNHSHHTYIYT